MKNVIRQKLAESNELTLPDFTPRTSIYIPDIEGKAKAIIGMRRAGKTTFIMQKIAEAIQAGTPRERLVYFSFEDERLAGITVNELSIITDEYFHQYPDFQNREKVTFFFDEIQLVAGWEQFIRRIIDSENIDVYLSGSSAHLLSREVATSMRGRAVEAIVYPFSFAESLVHQGEQIPKDPAFLSGRQRSKLENLFDRYLSIGGFPEAQGLKTRDQRHLLHGYVDSVILRDIAERYNLTNIPAIRWMVRQLLANAGGGFSANKFHKVLKTQKVRSSVEGLLNIFNHLEDAFLIQGVPIESTSERQRQVNPIKAYPIDPGFIPAFDRTGRKNLGHALENIVLIELLRRGADVTWIKTPNGYEVDFLARFPDGKMELIQVSAVLEAQETITREFRALYDAHPVYKAAPLRLITLHRESHLEIPDGPAVEVSPVYEWLLTQR